MALLIVGNEVYAVTVTGGITPALHLPPIPLLWKGYKI